MCRAIIMRRLNNAGTTCLRLAQLGMRPCRYLLSAPRLQLGPPPAGTLKNGIGLALSIFLLRVDLSLLNALELKFYFPKEMVVSRFGLT